MKEGRTLGLVIFLTFFILSVFYLSTRNNPISDDQTLPWQSKVNASGQTEIYNLVIGSSSFQDAIRTFGKDLEVSLFKNQDESFQLEAFYNNIEIAQIRGQLIVELLMSENQLSFLQNNIKSSEKLPTGNEKFELNLFAKSSLRNLTIKKIVFIPKTDIAPSTIIDRFGKADKISSDAQGVEYWLYPEKGLRIIYDANGKEMMEYSNL
jgi:hypothetical protein